MKRNKLQTGVLMMAIIAQISCNAPYVEHIKTREKEINCLVPTYETFLKNRQKIKEQELQNVFRVPRYKHIQHFEVLGSLKEIPLITNDGVDVDCFLSHRPNLKDYIVERPDSLENNQQAKIAIVYRNDLVGYGVMAVDDIEADSFIAPYVGNLFLQTEEQICESDYAFNVLTMGNKHVVVDSKDAGNESRFMNHSYTPNAKIVFARLGNNIQPWIQACIKIAPGEDICWNYGSLYWKAKGIAPIPDKEIPLYHGDNLSLYAVKVDEQDFSHVIVANDELFAKLNLVHHEIVTIEGGELIMIVHFCNEVFTPIALDMYGNLITDLSKDYGEKVSTAYKKRFTELYHAHDSEWGG